MSGPKLFSAPFFFLFIFFKLSYYSCVGNTTIACVGIEKRALLSLKQSLLDNPSNLFSSWNGEVSCCKWKGVVCNNLTGHVRQLRLRGYGLSGRLDSSLLNLKHLRYLDLSSNNFFGETIPSFIGSLASLKYLNLSYAGFHGTIPRTFGNLSNIHTLSLESSYGPGLNVDNLEWLSSLRQLEHLNLKHMNLSKAADWGQVINRLPHLVELHFQSCSLDFIDPISIVNVTSLTTLDLSHNKFHCLVPSWIFQLSSLIFLDLGNCKFEGPIPSISNTTKLQHIDFSRNNFNSSIPDWLYFCKDLQFVNFSGNSLHNTISKDIGNLSSLITLDLSANELSGNIPREIGNLRNMQELHLGGNQLEGEIPDSFGNMSNLEALRLWGNQLCGAIPAALGKLSSLQYVELSSNKLTGNVPKSLGQLFNLRYLYIPGNNLVGFVTENHFSNLTKLIDFVASRNHLTSKVNPNWVPPFQLEVLRLGSWNLGAGTQIPTWIKTQKNVHHLDLSNTGISGTVPSWIWEIESFNLSHNNLHGEVPDIISPVVLDYGREISLSSNNFTGSLPRIANAVLLDLSNNSFVGGTSLFFCDVANATYGTEFLDLGRNQLSGGLPDCLMKWPSLVMLDLGNNKFSGSIPNSIGLASLWSLNLEGNKFSGQIPSSLRNCTELKKIDLSYNDLDGNIPTWMGTSLVDLTFLILRSNKLRGEIPLNICHLNALQIFDLSDNKFSGFIPKCIDHFTAMATKSGKKNYHYYHYYDFMGGASVCIKGRILHYSTILYLVTSIDLSNNNFVGEIPKGMTRLGELRFLNLSENHLTGLIPDNIGDMKQLESLDLSRNSLSGRMPQSFAVMSSLNHLNLSGNNLTGRIPESTQLQRFNQSVFVGNDLCGHPLTRNCSDDHDQVRRPRNQKDNEGDRFKVEWLYVFLSLGYATGLSAVCSILVLKKSWREAYFGFLEDMWNKIYVYFCVKWTRLQRRWGRSS